MEEIKLFKAVQFTEEKILFASIEELELAHRFINDGKDIYIVIDNEAIKLLNQDISAKIYDGRVKLAAKL